MSQLPPPPDGFIIDAPQATPAPPPGFVMDTAPKAQPSMLSDIAHSALSGIREGVEGLAGMAGDVNQVNGNIASWVASKLGGSPETAAMAGTIARRLSPFGFMPTTQDVQTVDNPVVGKPYEPQTTAGDYARTIGEFAPSALLPESGGPVVRIANTLIPAVASETAGQATRGTQAEPYARVAGAMLGGLVPSGASRMVTPFPISPQRQAMTDALAKEGVDLTAGQKTGNNALRYAESEIGGNAVNKIMENQGEQFTKAALSRAGVNADRATPDVMDQAFNQIGNQFDTLASRNTLQADPQMASDISNVVKNYTSMVGPSEAAPAVVDIPADIAAKMQNGILPGDVYQGYSSRLGKMARAAKNKPELASALSGIKGALDDAMERSIATNNPSDLGAWQDARNKYRNMLVLEKAASGAGENSAQGLISPSQLRNATVQQNRRAYTRGQGDFADLARAGEGVMKPLPNSGTAGRLNARNLGNTLSTVAGAATGAATGGPIGAITGAAIGSAAPYAAGRLLLSKPVQAYLGNQAMTKTPEGSVARQALINALLARQSTQSIAP